MLKATNIKLQGTVITCKVTGVDFIMDFSVDITDWNNFTVSDERNRLDGCHIRNKLYSLYNENNGKLPKTFSLYFG